MTLDLPSREWNSTERVYPPELLPDVFTAQAQRTPMARAISFRGESVTYAQLDERIAGLAQRLHRHGMRKGALVAVCMDRSVEMVVALHAILRAGGAYVPIDPEYPDDRIAFMLDDLGEPLLLTQRGLAARFADRALDVMLLDAPDEESAAAHAAPLPRVASDDLAYVIYTSGSTGRPKGAMVTHGAIANRIYWMQEYFGLTPADRVLQKTPFSFDVSVWEFFWPLLFGAELVVAEPGGHRDSSYLTRSIIEHGITTIHFVPSMLRIFLEDPRAAECVSLRRVICSGEALPKALQDRFFAHLGAELHNLYGPTEAAVDVTAWACDPQSELPFVPIGRPIANTQMYVLDESMRHVPVGTAGELFIGGVQVGRGYLGRPELTAERFIEDPFRAGGTLYRTGDLARYLPDGAIEFLGRADFQVKIRGFRVELGEIESAIDSFDGVRASVVIAHERSAGDIELVAYVAHPSADAMPVRELRDHLTAQLPEYMVPARYIALDRFPLTSSGKVDRRALPAPGRARPTLDVSYAAPRNQLERDIAEKWQHLLEIDRVGIHDRFFELGGTSLQAARFVNEMQAESGVPLAVTTLFDAPSVAEYAAFIAPLAADTTADPDGAAVQAAGKQAGHDERRPPSRGRGALGRQQDRRRGGR